MDDKNYNSFNPFEEMPAKPDEQKNNAEQCPLNNFNSNLNGEVNPLVNKNNEISSTDRQQATFSTASGYYPPMGKKKKSKEHKKYGLSVVVACCIVCALLSGIVASGAMLLSKEILTKYNQSEENNSQSKTNSSNTIINVDDSTNELVTAIAKKVIPSVIGIKATASVSNFFGLAQQSESQGSGVVFKSDGYIITNYHVISIAVEAADQTQASINVYLPKDPDTAITAKVIGYDSDSDLAVIKIEKTGLTAIDIGSSSDLSVGETAVAVGNPGGLEYMGSVSSGIISGLNRTIKLEGTAEMEVIQTDAAINPGNSGGALVNSQGKLIGINSSKISDTAFEGMGFAIPSNHVVEVCNNIINNKDVKKAYVGVTISKEYTSDILKQMGYPAGAVVESVTSGSPAQNAGINQYDIITKFNGVAISDYSGYNTERLKCSPGDSVALTIYRNGQYSTVAIVLGESSN